MSIVPALIPNSLDDIRDTIALIREFTREVQIDIVDGAFVPFTSWPYRGGGSVMLLREWTDTMDIEVDLMIERPEEAVPLYIDAGAKRVVVHLESVTDSETLIRHHDTHGYQLGFSIGNDTPLEELTHVLPHADYVQLMGITDIGTQGQPFDERVLTRIREVLRVNPAMPISIDGSVNRDTLPRLKEAGATRFVSGSAILHADNPRGAYEELTLLL